MPLGLPASLLRLERLVVTLGPQMTTDDLLILGIHSFNSTKTWFPFTS